MRHHRTQRNGVTLVETLVMAVVAAAIISGFGWRSWRAREERRVAQCQSILLGYGKAINAYATDFGGSLPYESAGDESEGHVAWFDALSGYMAGTERICPSVDRSAPNAEEGYRLNSQLARSSAAPGDRYRRMDSLTRPEATVLLFDAEYGGKKRSLKGKLKDVEYRHRGSANVLFGDGHVRRFGPEELKESSNWLPPKIVWDPDPVTPAQARKP